MTRIHVRGTERLLRIANIACELTGVRAPSERRAVARLVARWDWRERQGEAAELGYVELGGEG